MYRMAECLFGAEFVVILSFFIKSGYGPISHPCAHVLPSKLKIVPVIFGNW